MLVVHPCEDTPSHQWTNGRAYMRSRYEMDLPQQLLQSKIIIKRITRDKYVYAKWASYPVVQPYSHQTSCAYVRIARALPSEHCECKLYSPLRSSCNCANLQIYSASHKYCSCIYMHLYYIHIYSKTISFHRLTSLNSVGYIYLSTDWLLLLKLR